MAQRGAMARYSTSNTQSKHPKLAPPFQRHGCRDVDTEPLTSVNALRDRSFRRCNTAQVAFTVTGSLQPLASR